MKKVSIALLSIAFLCSCGKEKKEDNEPGIFDIIEGVSDLNDVANEMEKIEEHSEKLISTTPLSNEELKALLPNSLINCPRKRFSLGNQFMQDVSMVEAEYEGKDGNIISFSIIDGAGETGSAMVALVRLKLSQNFEEQTDYGYKKSTTIKGHKAIEEIKRNNYDDTNENSKIELLISNRFIVSLDGKKTSLKELRKAFNELNLTSIE